MHVIRLIGIHFVSFMICASVARSSLGQTAPLTNKALLQYATTPYDKRAHMGGRDVLGVLGATEVVVEYICSDLCPDYTVRIIHFNVEPGAKCAAIGGVEKSTRVPISIASMTKVFCFPKILTEHWDAYIR